MIKPRKAEMLRMIKNDEEFGRSLTPTNRSDRRKLAKLVKQSAKRQGKPIPTTAATIKRAIFRIRMAGFTFELIERGLFYIRPIENLTEVQRQFLTENAEAITDFLYSEQNAAGTQND